ncbi:MAG: PilZ domain-containing protein, partial [Spirochaetales bacterium]|nr:PilZ domain-containing protein [Spirochaetales bacterium]
PKHVYLKCLGTQWPGIIYSTSMVGAKIIANIGLDSFELIKKANNLVALRFAFSIEDKKDKLLFFVSAKVSGFNPYSKDNPNLNFINLVYTKRPPDDLIAILGQMLEINVNSKKRTDDRIDITADSIRILGLVSKNAKISLEGIPRTCIVRDISFSGAKIILPGIAKFLNNKKCVLGIIARENKIFTLKGKVVRVESVADRKDIAVLAIKFNEDSISMDYKKMINNYLTVKRNKGNRL